VFARAAGQWLAHAYVKASNTDAGDNFGFSVALSSDGNTLAVGAIGEASIGSSPDDDFALGAGAVYVFTRPAGKYSQQAYVKAFTPTQNSEFGLSVALSGDGNTLAVGAPGEASAATGIDGDQTDKSAAAAGAVFVFTRTAGQWLADAYVKASNTDLGDNFGFSIALSSDGNTLAVGAIGEDGGATGVGNQIDNAVGQSGAVYMY